MSAELDNQPTEQVDNEAQEEIEVQDDTETQAATETQPVAEAHPNITAEDFKKFGNPLQIIDELRKLNDIGHEEIFDRNLDKIYHHTKDSFESMNQNILYDMVEALTYTFHANYVNLEGHLSPDKLHPDRSPNFSGGIYSKTEWLLKLMIEYFLNPRLRFADLHILNSFTTGSITTDWICRSFMWFLAFINFYNHYIDAGLVTKNIRSDFKTKYHRYYKRRLPSLNPRIEIIIKGGIRKIDIEKELPVYALGALLYDVGKILHVNYYDNNAPYDEEKEKLHALAGFNLLAKTKQYSFPVLAMAAFHHEYYGGKRSYNFTNSLIAKLFHRERNDASILNYISFEARDFIDGSSFAFCPPKFMEIVDLYTELITKGKLTTAEALTTMKREYIAYSLQIDPILFEIFSEFMCKCELLDDAEKTQIDGIIY